jgi:hypothetical protein
MTIKIPEKSSLYAHKESGQVYEIIAVSNTTATQPGWPITVFYTNLETSELWSRPLDAWLDRLILLKGLDTK